ncbi:MAG: GumC family protein [Pseudomonadota bacterium]
MAETAPTIRDLIDLLALLRRRIWIVILLAVGAAIAAAAVSMTLKPVYRATTQVLIDPSIRQPFEDQSAPTRYLEDTFVVDSQVTVLQSYSVLREVVTQLNLTEDPEFGEGAPAQGFMALLGSLLGGSEERSPESLELAANKSVDALRDATSVSRDGLTFVINVSVDAQSPVKAAILSNAIVETYISDQNGQVSNLSRTVEEKVGDRLKILREQLREAEAKVEAFKAENNLQSTGQNALLTDQELTELNTRLTEERAALAAAIAKSSEIQRIINSGASVDALSDVTASPTIANLRQQYATAARTQANLSAELLPSHPDLIRARAQTQEIRGLIDAEVQRIASSAKLEADVLRDRVANLETQMDNVRAKSNIDQQSRIELQELQIEADASKTLYENLLSRTKEITEIEQISIPNARIISPAIPPETPVWPKKKILVLIGGFLGALIGGLLAIGRETFSLGIRYLLYPQDAGNYALVSASPSQSPPQAPAPAAQAQPVSVPPANPAQNSLDASVSYLPRLPYQDEEDELNARELLDSLWDFKSGVTDHEMRPYWKSVFTILKQIQSNRIDGFASTVVVTSPDGDHNMATLSIVFAAASLKNFRVLLVENNSVSQQLTGGTLPTSHRTADLQHAIELPDLDIGFLSLNHGRRKYEGSGKNSYQALNKSRLDPEFDLIVISESPMSQPQAEALLQTAADHVVFSVEGPAVLT